MRWITIVLAVLLAMVQVDLWFGRSSLPYVWSLEQQLQVQKDRNAAAALRNRQVAAEVGDLREGLEMVEEKARAELGMLKPDEVLVQVTARR